MKRKLFLLGNNFFPQLSFIYDFRTAKQAELIAQIGFYGNINDYFKIIDFHPDIIFITDESLPVLYSGLECLSAVKIAYLIDTHIHYHWHKVFVKQFDYCFVAQKNYYALLKEENPNCSWLPLFATDDMNLGLQRDIDISFVGTLDIKRNRARVKFIDDFAKQHKITVASGDYREIFNRSKIILNQSVSDDINFRVFEAMACGAMLLTDNVGNGIDELFIGKKDLVLYEKGNVADAVAKTRYYLENEDERLRIASNGYLKTVAAHCTISRIIPINKALEKLSFLPSGF